MSRRVAFTTLKPIDAAVSNAFVDPAFKQLQQAPLGIGDLPGNKRMADKIAELEARYSKPRRKKAPKKKRKAKSKGRGKSKGKGKGKGKSKGKTWYKKTFRKEQFRRGRKSDGTLLTGRTTLQSIVRQLSWGSTPLRKLLKTTGPLHKRASLLSLLRRLPQSRTSIFTICGKSGCS